MPIDAFFPIVDNTKVDDNQHHHNQLHDRIPLNINFNYIFMFSEHDIMLIADQDMVRNHKNIIEVDIWWDRIMKLVVTNFSNVQMMTEWVI